VAFLFAGEFDGATQLPTAEKAARRSQKKEERRKASEENPRDGHTSHRTEDRVMSKGMNRKKEEKKKPAKSLEEKRAAKKSKKAERSFILPP
jgi:hypothetical protein